MRTRPPLLAPALATPLPLAEVGPYVLDDAWVMEQKLDGHRVLLTYDGQTLWGLSRDGSVYQHPLPPALLQWRFPPGLWALDGELVAPSGSGSNRGTFWAFDLLVAGGQVLHDQPLYARRAALETLLTHIRSPFQLIPQAKTAAEKEALMVAAAERRFEGVVLKRSDSVYTQGRRASSWLKVKYVVTADVVVMAVGDDGKASAKLGIYRDGTLCGIGRCSLIGRPEVSAGDVVEVRYIHVGTSGRLVQPIMVRPRPDKHPTSCTGEDFKHVTKDVLDTLP